VLFTHVQKLVFKNNHIHCNVTAAGSALMPADL
jgi:hypothetical protein